jgi:isoleucyl-tRNA synthetase
MDKYDTIKSCRLIKDFAEDLSLWYVRRSRDRFKEENQEKEQAQNILRFVLLELSKIIAPILPYTAEFIYEKIGKDKEESVHLETWPKADKRLIDNELEEKMQEVRRIVSLALAERTAKGLKVRQPLALLKVKNSSEQFHRIVPLLDLIKDEVNVKEIIFDDKIENEVELDLNITEELKEEGVVREIIRAVQGERKNQKLVPEDKIFVKLSVPEYEKSIIQKNKDLLLKEFRAVEISVELSVDLKIKIKKL